MPQYLTFFRVTNNTARLSMSRQITEVSTFILHLKFYLAFLSVFIVATYNNVTSFWL